jgi:hypothetical protein
MKRWEFLIQQEGHPTWQPISQATWEGEAGNYRLVAHAERPHLDVEINVVHETLEAGVTHRHCEKLSRRTNSEGLITILPLTDLQSGIWEIRCYGDLMDELLGQGWQQSIRLQISPKEAINADKMLEMLASSENPEFSIFENEFEPENELPILAVEPADGTPQLPEMRLILDQDALIRVPGELISLAGKIEVAAGIWDDCDGHIFGERFAGKLRLELKEPACPDVLFAREYSLTEQPLPINFTYSLEIPGYWETPLLEGEVTLVAEDGNLLASHSLTIATDLNAVVEEEPAHVNYTIELASTEGDSSFSFDLLIPEEVAATSLPLKVVEPPKIQSKPGLILPAGNHVLPPKLSRFRPPQRLSPQLPKLPPKPQPVAVAAATPTSEVMPEKLPNSVPNLENLPNVAGAIPAFSAVEALNTLPGQPAAEALPKSSERFLSRLNSLATGS